MSVICDIYVVQIGLIFVSMRFTLESSRKVDSYYKRVKGLEDEMYIISFWNTIATTKFFRLRNFNCKVWGKYHYVI